MKANLKSGEEGPRKISQSDPSNSKFLFIRCLVARPFPPSSTSPGPPKFPVLCSSLLPSLLCSLPTPSLIIPPLFLSLPPFLFAASEEALNSRPREAGEYARKGSGARRGEKGNGGRGGKQEWGISSARAKAFFKECSIIRARKSERSSSIRRDNRILTSRPPFIYWQPVAFTFYFLFDLYPPPKPAYIFIHASSLGGGLIFLSLPQL